MLCSSGIARDSKTDKPLGDHYLLLVTAASASILSQEKIVQFDQSDYQGLAVTFLNPYDTSPIPSAEDMQARLTEWKKSTKKDIWPWLFLNRMIGPNPSEDNPNGRNPYFSRIKGADLEGGGSQKDFLTYWQNSLQAARATHAPGVVVDLEFYMNYAGYDPTKLAKQAGKSPAEIVTLLRQLGMQLADTAAKAYPHATLWLLFTDLGDPKFVVAENGSYYPSPAYIVLGLLDEIQSKQYALNVISGGEVGLGYCHTSINQLKMKIRNRAADFSPILQKYSGTIELGGVLTLWNEPAGKSGWLNSGYCAQSSAFTAEDLEPFLELILQSYRYNWIYASGDGSYFPFQARSASRFDAVIEKAQHNVYSTGSSKY
jgi:hypothetical protein